MWVVVAALKLQSGLEDFGGDVDNRCCEITEEACLLLVTYMLNEEGEDLPAAK